MPSPISPVTDIHECGACRQRLDPMDRYCRSCGRPISGSPLLGWFRIPPPTPEQAGKYWHYFFRPFFIMVFIIFGAFFLMFLVMVAIWFLMFR